MRTFDITTAQLSDFLSEMRIGDRVLLTGTVYTARDAAHKELFRLLDEGEELPFELKSAVIYYAGPTPAKDDCATGSCGPTTSSRMDSFAPRLYDLGLSATIGKGERNQSVIDSIVKNAAVYLCAVGGAGALISKHITASEEIAFQHLGCESVKKLTVEKLPLTVGIDSNGGNIFKEAREKYKK